MAVSNIPIVPRDGKVEILDAAGAITHELTYEAGNTSGGNQIAERIVIYDRHEIASVRKGKVPVAQVSFSVHLREFANGSDVIPIDFAEFSGAAAGASRTTGVTGDHNTVDLQFTATKTTLGDSANAVIRYDDCVLLWDWAEGEPGVVNFTAECYGPITRTGQA